MLKKLFGVISVSFCLLFVIGLFSLSFSQPVLAADSGDVCGGSGRYFLGIPSWDRGIGSCEDIGGEEFLSGDKIKLIANNIVAILTHLAAFIAVGFIVFGGIRYILSSGNAEQAADARKTIINAIIGTIIVIMARVFTEVIHQNLTN